MKNRLIYGLMVLMVISLVGIIAIQVLWISDAVEQQTANFKSHVNDALNRVNSSISDDEAVFFIDEKFGGLDSLINEVRFFGDETNHEVQVVSENDANSKKHIEVKFDYVDSEVGEQEGKVKTVRSSSWIKKMEVRSDDTVAIEMKSGSIDTSKLKNVSSIVEHFSFEKSLSGELSDRISPDTLNNKLKKALKEEGIESEFSYAVYNNDKQQIEKEFKSKSFNSKGDAKEYSKVLFPNDRINDGKYKLRIQFEKEGSYVWKNVRLMAFSSGIFTILILISFGYALYFIYKQKKISRIKNDFINNMTHELKTPLATISLASSSIKHPSVIGNAQEVERFATIIENEKKRMNTHIERVLEIAALDKGEVELVKEEITISELIKQSIENSQLSLNEVGGTIEFTEPTTLIKLRGDSYHLLNVLNNVIDNGIKYKSEQVPNIKIELKNNAKNVEILISDNGIGMDSTTKKLAFDKFYRAEKGNIHATKGFGLGLSYVKKIVEAHEGVVTIESKLNQGTTISIKLPKE